MCEYIYFLSRQFSIHNLDQREQLERLYICLEVYFRTLQVWIRLMLPPTIFAPSCAIIIAVFVSIRFTSLPFILYQFFPSTAVTIPFLLFWIIFEMELTTRGSEDLRGRLLSREPDYVRRMLKDTRIRRMLSRARATRQVSYPIGEFADVSLSLGVNMWEECLNQVIFLLTL